jgi:PAS domain S-box-containing protein
MIQYGRRYEMRYFFSYCHFFAAVMYALMGIAIIVKDYRSRINQTCTAIFTCFFLWSFSFVWMHHPDTSKATVEIFEKVGSFGWICFSFFHLWFAWVYTRRRPFKFFNAVAMIFVIVPVLLLFQQVSGSVLISPSEHLDFGWLSRWHTSVWTNVYFIYYTVVVFLGLYGIFDYYKKSDNTIVKRQSLILIISGLITFLIGTIANVILPSVSVHPVAPLADVGAVVWAAGLAYVAIKYNMLDINPFIAAQRIITTMKDLLFLLDGNGRIISVNQSALQTLSCTQESLTGKPFSEVISNHETQRIEISKKILTSPAYTGETMLAVGLAPSIPVSISTSIVEGAGIVCVAHDISLQKQRTESLNKAKKQLEHDISLATEELKKNNIRLTEEIAERKEAALALMETEERFRVIYEYAPDGIYLISQDGDFVDANKEARRILGCERNDLKTKNAFTLGILPSLDQEIFSGPFPHTMKSHSSECIFTREDHGAIPVEINLHPVKIGDRHLILGVIRDLTLQKKAEEEAEELKRQLHQAQKMEAIGRLAGGIAHDFNNLLGGILGYAGILQKTFIGNHPAEAETAKKVLDTSRQASTLVAQLLAFARKGKYKVEPVDMHTVIDEVVGLLEQSVNRAITLKKTFRASSSMVMGDRSQLHSALLNLGVNARDALPQGGEIAFTTDTTTIEDADARKYPYSIQPGVFFKLTVADNGIGMDEKVRSHVFEPFFSTKETGKGTGLGLASVYGTIKNHNGYINLWSEPGKGTTFTICLPLSFLPKEVDQPKPDKEKLAAPRRGGILVVDDVPVMREIIVDVLQSLGYTVTACCDGCEALDWFREHQSNCDLVIMDLTMPRLSGGECFKAMKQINPSVRTIITSGHTADSEIDELLKEGALAFLQKPFEIERLSDAVQSALSVQDPQRL